MAKRRADDAPEPKDPEEAGHAGEMMQGTITELRTREKGDTRFEKRSHYDGSGRVGFDLRPRPKRMKRGK